MLRESADILWHIVTACVAEQQLHGRPAPCVQVDPEQRFAVMKDRRGVLQHLLLLTDKVPGIEDPRLGGAALPDYWALAWQARKFATTHDAALSITVNSARARTQNQLHLHISCTRPEVAREVTDMAAGGLIDTQLRPVPGGLAGHAYRMRRIDFAYDRVFRITAQLAVAEGADAGDYSAAVMPAVFADDTPGFVLLIDRSDAARGAAAETLQDHDCAMLR